MLRYLKGPTDDGLVYDKKNNTSESVIGYVDSNFAGNLDRIRSLTSYVFTFASGAISGRQQCNLKLSRLPLK